MTHYDKNQCRFTASCISLLGGHNFNIISPPDCHSHITFFVGCSKFGSRLGGNIISKIPAGISDLDQTKAEGTKASSEKCRDCHYAGSWRFSRNLGGSPTKWTETNYCEMRSH